jgi:hypothetical protein
MSGRPVAFRYVLASACATVVVVSACGSVRHRTQMPQPVQTDLAVFSHPLAGAIEPVVHGLPDGAVLARLSGQNHVYVSQQSLSEEGSLTQGLYLCITDVESSEVAGTVCGRAEKVEREGLMAVHLAKSHVRLGMLLPNGVATITIVNRNGSRQADVVSNNVVEVEDNEPVMVEYTLADGLAHREAIPHGFISPAISVRHR